MEDWRTFLYSDLKTCEIDPTAVHASDLTLLVKRAKTLNLFAFGVDIFDNKCIYIDTFIPESEEKFWYEEKAEEFLKTYPNHYFAFTFSPGGGAEFILGEGDGT